MIVTESFRWIEMNQVYTSSLHQNQVLCAFILVFVQFPPHPPIMLNTSISKVYHLLSDMGNASYPKKSCQLQQLIEISSL